VEPSRDDTGLAVLYEAYLSCLNGRRWDDLGNHVDQDVVYNGEPIRLDGYRAMLERDVHDIPDLRFGLGLLIVQQPWLAAQLEFDCHPAGSFLSLPVAGRRVTFTENVFYRFTSERIVEVRSVIDKTAVERQLSALPHH
jgi:predicted ester cyclase